MSGLELLWLSFGSGWLTLCTAAPMWAVTDATRLPNAAWTRSGKDKRVWVVLPVFATLLCGVGGLVATYSYYTRIRPAVREQISPPEPSS